MLKVMSRTSSDKTPIIKAPIIMKTPSSTLHGEAPSDLFSLTSLD